MLGLSALSETPLSAQPESGGASVNVSPGTASLTISGQAPTVAASVSASPDIATLTLTGFAPTVSTATNVTVEPSTGSLVLSGQAPSVSAGATVAPSAGALTINGAAPTIVASSQALPAAGALALTGSAPSVSATAEIIPFTGSLTFTGFAPEVGAGNGDGSDAVSPMQTGAHGRKRGRELQRFLDGLVLVEAAKVRELKPSGYEPEAVGVRQPTAMAVARVTLPVVEFSGIPRRFQLPVMREFSDLLRDAETNAANKLALRAAMVTAIRDAEFAADEDDVEALLLAA